MLRLGVSLTVSLAVASQLNAQVPDGDYVTSAFRVARFLVPAGVFVVDRETGVSTAVTNLPREVIGASMPNAPSAGPDFVALRPDGVLVTNGASFVSTQLPVFFLALQGTTVIASMRYDVGTVRASSSRGLPQAHVLPDGSVLIAVDDATVGIAGEPLFGALLGIVDPNAGPPGAPGTVRSIPVAPRPRGRINALAVDEVGGIVYLAMVDPSGFSGVFRVPFPSGGAPVLVASFVDSITGLAVDHDRRLIATASGSGGLHRIDPSAGA